MNDLISFIGLAAAALTSLSYIPQVQKAWPRNSTDDLSVKTLSTLSAGLALWILYGVGKRDWVIILSNVIAVVLALTVLAFKIRDTRQQQDAR
jgi:MtN3 and saliva related transmembrane protein